MQDIRKAIQKRVYLLYIGVLLFSFIIILQIIRIQFIQGNYWKERAKEFAIKTQVVKATRGNIFADDGKSLFATSVPIFELRLNATSRLITNKDFNKTVQPLADSLSILFKDRTAAEYRNLIMKGRRDKKRGGYLLIAKNVTYEQLKRVRKFPRFRSGKNAIALDVKQEDKRVMPYDLLAKRTIGFIGIREKNYKEVIVKGNKKKGTKDTKVRVPLKVPELIPVYAGLEGYFSRSIKKLEGVDGKRLVRLAPGGERLPLYNDSSIVEPKNGKDLVTTINVDLQEVAHNSLIANLIKNKAEHGCAILMEVATGQIKAIANLKRDSSNGKTTFTEAFNYAIGEAADPGSTFKLPSLMVALEDGVVDTNSLFNTGFAQKQFGAKTIRDVHVLAGINTVKRIFEESSNIGTVSVIWGNYSKNPQKFINGLYKLRINEPLGLTIYGERAPDIKNTKSDFWHTEYSLPSMAYGYEILITPLQILTLYNAVANNGKMVRPMFVKEIRVMGKTVEKYYPTTINSAICSKETLGKAKKMLEGVVERGTAEKLFKGALYKVAGKTGTAQISYANKGTKMIYRASFVGYFPADNPKYSCIVVVTNPSAGAFYGGAVAAPVFRDIADKVYSTLLHNYREDEMVSKKEMKTLANVVNSGDMKKMNDKLNFITGKTDLKSLWSTVKLDTVIRLNESPVSKIAGVPNVVGMGLKNAVFMLENSGYRVKVSGKGVVRSQKLINPKEIKLELS